MKEPEKNVPWDAKRTPTACACQEEIATSCGSNVPRYRTENLSIRRHPHRPAILRQLNRFRGHPLRTVTESSNTEATANVRSRVRRTSFAHAACGSVPFS
jgi:hypothetical protein